MNEEVVIIDEDVKEVYKVLKKVKLKKTNLLFGGDHSVSYFLIKSLIKINMIKKEDILIIFDAHFDGFKREKNSKVKNWNFINEIKDYFDKVIILGFRDYNSFELNEYENIKIIDIHMIKTKLDTVNKILKEELKNKHIYLSIDVDCIDPKEFPGVSYAMPNGLTTSELERCLDHILEVSEILFIDIVEFNPMIEYKVSVKVLKKIIYKLLVNLKL